jgi:hypothetical protein
MSETCLRGENAGPQCTSQRSRAIELKLCDLVAGIDFRYFGLSVLFAERNGHASADLNVLDAFRSFGCFEGFLAAFSFKDDPVLALVDLQDRSLYLSGT